VLSTLGQTPYATAALYAEPDRLRLALRTPHDPAWTSPARQFYFGPGTTGAAPAPLRPAETLLSLTTYRDLAALWGAASELFTEEVAAQFDQAEGQFSTLFAGLDFSEQVLGALGPHVQLVAKRQTFVAGSPREPQLKLPAFALVFELKDAAGVEQQLRVSFQSLIGFTNIVGAQAGQPALDLTSREHGGGRILSTRYLIDEANPKNRGLINYNFSPSLAFVSGRMIVSSTAELAAELIDAAGQPQAGAGPDGANTVLTLSGTVLRGVLADNRGQLIAQNVLQKGHDQAQAEREIDGLLGLLAWLQGAEVRLARDGQALQLEASLHVAPPK
jgi:hypothetical protein